MSLSDSITTTKGLATKIPPTYESLAAKLDDVSDEDLEFQASEEHDRIRVFANAIISLANDGNLKESLELCVERLAEMILAAADRMYDLTAELHKRVEKATSS